MHERTFLAALRKHIEKKYITQVAAAKVWGVSPQHLQKILTGSRPPTVLMEQEMGYKRVVSAPLVTYKRI